MYYVYILKSFKNQRFYTGLTNDLERRLIEHNNGKTKSIRFTRPFELIYKEIYNTRIDAVRRERFFKTGKGREELKRILRAHSSVG